MADPYFAPFCHSSIFHLMSIPRVKDNHQKWVSGCNLNSDLPAIKNISIVLYSILLSSRASVNCLSDPDSLLQHGEYICVCSILAFTGPNNDCITKIH